MKKYVYIILCFWIALISISIIKNECILNMGREVLLETQPVDPTDLVRGEYVKLNYAITEIPSSRRYFENGEIVYVKLQKDRENIAHYSEITTKKPDGLYIKGKTYRCQTANNGFKNGACVKYGIESYFVKEGTALEIEKKLSKGGLAKVVIDKNGNAKIIGLIE